MSLVRYTTANDFATTSFSNLIDRFFTDSVARSGGSSYSFVPKVDVLESEKGYEVSLLIAGLSKEDFKIDLNENVLTISGERKFSKEKKENKLHVLETQYGNFSRSFSLPENVDAAKIEASYKNGLLEIFIPKDEKKTLKTTITVN